MRIQHNIMAMGAYRNYTNNVSAMKKNLEKLSSGYKINRAGDDAAGLAISEKMRAQITGLQTAQKNAKDGISLVQTAEGALTEVHDMLNRMVELANMSANGTYDDSTDRTQLQKEVTQLTSEINRIADSANFNGIKLLDGSMADGVVRTNTTGGEMTDVPILQNVATDPTVEVGKATVLHKDSAEPGPTIITAELHNVEVKGQVGDKVKFSIGDTEIELAVKTTGTVDSVKGELVADKAYGGADLANMIAKAFKAGAQTIGGQAFKVSADGSTLTFTQAAKPTSKDEVVDANVPVTVSMVSNPAGHQMDYSTTIVNGSIGIGGKLSIGDVEFTVAADSAGNADLISTINGAAKSAAATSITKTLDNGYTVKYTKATGELKITDAKGDLGKPEVKYDTYGDKQVITADRTKGEAAVAEKKAEATTFKLKVGDKFSIDGTTYTVKTTAGHTLSLAAAGTTSDTMATTNYDLTLDANGIVTIKAKATGTEGNVDVDYSVTRGTGDKAEIMDRTVTLTGGVNQADATNAVTKYDLSGLKNGDKITIAGKDYIFDTSLAKTFATAGGTTMLGDGAVTGKIITDTNYTTYLDGDTLVIEKKAAGAAQALAPAITVQEKKDTTAVLKETGKTNSMDGTWNVQSTKNTQGAAEGSGQLASTTFDLTADMVKDGNSLTIGNATYTFKVGKDSTVTGDNVIDLSHLEADSTDLIAEAAKQLANQDNEAFTIGYSPDTSIKTISIHEKEGQTVYTNGELNSVEEFDKLVYCKTPTVTENTVEGKSLTLQIGDTADDFNKLKVDIADCHADAIGIGDIDISTQEGAAAAVDKIKAAINTVSDVRGTLGATQNRLDHTINNLSVMTENIQDAESTIRDVDVAEEMMAYTKNNILIQSAQAMLAQANQVPQGVLQLLG